MARGLEVVVMSDPVHGRLVSMREGEFQAWLSDLLRYGYTGDIPLFVGDGPPSLAFIRSIWESIDDADLEPGDRRRLRGMTKCAIEEMIRGWAPPAEPPEFFAELLNLVGTLNLVSCFDVLLGYAFEGSFKGRIGSVDIHRQILRVIFPMPARLTEEAESKLRAILDRDIEEPEYASLCFRKAWMREPDRGPSLMRKFIATSFLMSPKSVEQALERYHRTMGADHFFSSFLEIRVALLRAHSYKGARSPSALYRSYLRSIRGVCKVECIVPASYMQEPKVQRLLRKFLNEEEPASSEKQQTGFRLHWRPQEEPRRSVDIPAPVLKADLLILEAVLNTRPEGKTERAIAHTTKPETKREMLTNMLAEVGIGVI
jgi:hypothetical protein